MLTAEDESLGKQGAILNLKNEPALADGLQTWLAAGAATTLLAGLLVIGHTLNVLGQTLFFARLFETAQHLLGRFVAARLHLDHRTSPFEYCIALRHLA